MVPTQKMLYTELIDNYAREIRYNDKVISDEDENDEKCGTFRKGSSMLMGLRKAANHPLLIRSRYDDRTLRSMSNLMLKEPTHKDANPQFVFEDMQQLHDFELHELCKKYSSLKAHRLDMGRILDSGKFQELDKMLPKFKSDGNRVLLFSQFTMMLDIIEEYMEIRQYKYLRLDGATRVTERQDLIDTFNDDPSIFVFLLSTRAGGLGNIQIILSPKVDTFNTSSSFRY